MCTLILGRDVLAPATVLLAANRDEDPSRPSDPPMVLRETPRVVGGRDRRAGGTWLAVREGRAVVALLNRRDDSGEPGPEARARPSRGALVLDVASVAEDYPARLDPTGERHDILERLGDVSGQWLPYASLCRAFEAVWESAYAPCTLLFAAPDSCWLMALEADAPPRFEPIHGGWHVITHADMDDPLEPRTVRLARELADFAPGSLEQAEQRLDDLLRSHGDVDAGIPPVCLHAGRRVTVSTSSVWLAAGAARYRHAEGRPCEHPFVDHSHLLRAPTPAEEKR
jgi:hypothetical protein